MDPLQQPVSEVSAVAEPLQQQSTVDQPAAETPESMSIPPEQHVEQPTHQQIEQSVEPVAQPIHDHVQKSIPVSVNVEEHAADQPAAPVAVRHLAQHGTRTSLPFAACVRPPCWALPAVE